MGNIAAAAALIDVSRVGKGRMKALAGVITDSLMPVPGMDPPTSLESLVCATCAGSGCRV